MSVYSSNSGVSEAEPGSYFYQRHDAYKALISQVAGQLGAEDLQSIFWHIDASPKLRNGSALAVLEYLQRAGRFSERNVQFLSELLKKVDRVDLMSTVDDYTVQYGKLKYDLAGYRIVCCSFTPT